MNESWEVVTFKSFGRQFYCAYCGRKMYCEDWREGGVDLEACLMTDCSRRIVVLKLSATEMYFVENVTKGFQKFSVRVPALLFLKQRKLFLF
jgi:hypothetical protein